jgi:phenylacetate-CoA ligase
MIDNAATVLCCTPTYALHLAEVAAEEKIDLKRSSIKRIIAAGEPGASIPSTRALIESKWNGARVYDHHGMTEIGPASYECPARPGVLHMIEPSFISEVIDGELVLTNIGRTASPLLRYRTGDLVSPSKEEICKCGSRELALEGGILGRIDDMLTIRGVNVYPGAVEQIIRSFDGIPEYRVELKTIRGLVEMTVEIETDQEDLAHQVQQALNRAFGLRVPVRLAKPGSLPRFEMKARRWTKS